MELLQVILLDGKMHAQLTAAADAMCGDGWDVHCALFQATLSSCDFNTPNRCSLQHRLFKRCQRTNFASSRHTAAAAPPVLLVQTFFPTAAAAAAADALCFSCLASACPNEWTDEENILTHWNSAQRTFSRTFCVTLDFAWQTNASPFPHCTILIFLLLLLQNSTNTITQVQLKWQQSHFAASYRSPYCEKEGRKPASALIALYFSSLSFVSPNYLFAYFLFTCNLYLSRHFIYTQRSFFFFFFFASSSLSSNFHHFLTCSPSYLRFLRLHTSLTFSFTRSLSPPV